MATPGFRYNRGVEAVAWVETDGEEKEFRDFVLKPCVPSKQRAFIALRRGLVQGKLMEIMGAIRVSLSPPLGQLLHEEL